MDYIENLLSVKVYERVTPELYLAEYIEVHKITSDGSNDSELYEIIRKSESAKSFKSVLKKIGHGKSVAQAFGNAIENTPDDEEKLEILTVEAIYHNMHPEIFNKYDEHQLLLDLAYYQALSKFNNKRMDKECED